jgi:glycosyltransferase involved in cell wall biosynthesis
LRIGAILPHLLVFGGVRRYIELGNVFTSRGHRFVLYTPDGNPPEWLHFRGEVKALENISDLEHDVLMCGSPELLEYIDRAKVRIRIFYIQGENVLGEDRIIRSGKYHIMVNSSGLARKVRRRHSIEPLDGIGGINTELFHSARKAAGNAPFRVICYGRLSRPHKGTRFVVKAVRWMYRRGYDVELHLFDTITPGNPDPRIGFNPRIPFRYFIDLPQSRMASMYGAADIFVSAEHRTGWCNTAAEAASCGLPLVCTKSGTEDFAIDGMSAIVIPFRCSHLIRRALARIYHDRSLGKKLGEEAQRRITEFTWDKLCDRMERSFRKILDTGRF